MRSVDGIMQFSAADLVGHLACRHLTRLEAAVARGEPEAPKRYDPFLEILWQRGAAHERDYVAHLKSAGLDVEAVNTGADKEALPINQTIEAMRAGRQVIVQRQSCAASWYIDVCCLTGAPQGPVPQQVSSRSGWGQGLRLVGTYVRMRELTVGRQLALAAASDGFSCDK